MRVVRGDIVKTSAGRHLLVVKSSPDSTYYRGLERCNPETLRLKKEDVVEILEGADSFKKYREIVHNEEMYP